MDDPSPHGLMSLTFGRQVMLLVHDQCTNRIIEWDCSLLETAARLQLSGLPAANSLTLQVQLQSTCL